jgi:hypothetical protein
MRINLLEKTHIFIEENSVTFSIALLNNIYWGEEMVERPLSLIAQGYSSINIGK